jgi:RelA/SpoT family (p)ppGpp synthetase
MDEKLDTLISLITNHTSASDIALLKKAYAFSFRAHADQLRASGEGYFLHCLAVAVILTELKLDAATVTAALLHDTLEDTGVGGEELRREFGSEVADMVEGVTKINSCHFADSESAQAENWRKMLRAISKDIRVILIKLADRLHNLRTIRHLLSARQRAVATETLNFYAPFAQRLGIYRWKSEMEDLSFAVIMPDEYRTLYEQWELRQGVNARSIEIWKKLLEKTIHPAGIPFRLSARPKSLYGIYRKMERQHKQFAEIQDIIGLRLITDTASNCYALLGIVKKNFMSVEGSFSDYIAMPKMNRYQSIHTTIEDQSGAVAELQIRTEAMHRRSEYGIAAHWRYKEQAGLGIVSGEAGIEEIDEKLDWLKQVIEWQNELTDSREFLETFRTECMFEQIFVFTPKGKVIKLPKNATPVDFAYAVHVAIGNSCCGARVGNRPAPLDTCLQSGEICEILTRKNAHPHEHWLAFVITAKARSRIRRYLREHRA